MKKLLIAVLFFSVSDMFGIFGFGKKNKKNAKIINLDNSNSGKNNNDSFAILENERQNRLDMRDRQEADKNYEGYRLSGKNNNDSFAILENERQNRLDMRDRQEADKNYEGYRLSGKNNNDSFAILENERQNRLDMRDRQEADKNYEGYRLSGKNNNDSFAILENERQNRLDMRDRQEADENYEGYRLSGKNPQQKLTRNSVEPNGPWADSSDDNLSNLLSENSGREVVHRLYGNDPLSEASGSSHALLSLTPEQRSIAIEAEQKAKKAEEALEDKGGYPADLYNFDGKNGELPVNGTRKSTPEEQADYARYEYLTPAEREQEERLPQNNINQQDPQEHTDPQEEGEVPNWYGW